MNIIVNSIVVLLSISIIINLILIFKINKEYRKVINEQNKIYQKIIDVQSQVVKNFNKINNIDF